jgi:hypothetical protein
MTAQQNHRPSPAELELELAARRARLAGTIDELIDRSAPKEVARRSLRGFREKLTGAVRTPDGDLRVERVTAVAVAALVVVAVMALARRRRG